MSDAGKPRKDETKTTEYQRIGDTVSIYKRGRVWYANYQLNGKQVRRSLGTAIKHEAIARANGLERDLAVGKSPRKMAKVTAAQVRDEYFAELTSLGRQKDSIRHYRPVLRRLIEYMETRDARWISQIDLPLAEGYRRWLQTLVKVRNGKERRLLCDQTISDHLVIVHSFVLYAYRRKYLDLDPLLGLPISSPARKQQPFWTWEEVLRILAAAPPEYRPLFEFLARTGTRIGEAVHLDWTDVDFENGILHIRAKENWRPKSGEARAIPMCQDVRTVLRGLTPKGRWVLTRPDTGRKCISQQIVPKNSLKALRAVLAGFGLTGHHHTFRHSFISHALTQGVPEAVVRSWVGHVDPAILRLYTHVASSISKAQMQDLFGSKSTPDSNNTAG